MDFNVRCGEGSEALSACTTGLDPAPAHALTTGLIKVKEEGWTGFSKGLLGCTEEQPCQPEENLVHPDSFSWINILFKIGYFGDISDFFHILMFKEAYYLLSFWNMPIIS